MSYIGNTPAENYASFLTETFSVSATVNYTLSHAVSNENDIRLVINGVIQQPGSGKAYTASGTTLTLTSATVSGDSMYAVYLGRALQTVNPPAASVGNSQTAPTIITGQTAETSIATDDTILIHDTSASALKKMTRANFVSGIGGTNTPAFQVKINTEQTPSNNTITKVNFDTEDFDTASAYDTSNKRFVVPSGQGGKYFFYSSTCVGANTNASYQQSYLYIYKNNSAVNTAHINTNDDGNGRYNQMVVTSVLDLNASDYIEIFAKIILASGGCEIRTAESVFGGYKIIE